VATPETFAGGVMAASSAFRASPGVGRVADRGGYGGGGYGGGGGYVVTGDSGYVSQVGYTIIPQDPNQAFGELLGIQQANPANVISGTDSASGIRDGNVTRNQDGSLDVTNGTVVTFSFITGRAEVVTVTSGDVAHIDAKTGLVDIQKPI